MATVINMPKLGFDMAEGLLVRWVKAEGETVEIGEVLAEIETDKATVEVEAETGGVILKHLAAENTSVPIGAPITVIGEPGEEFDAGSIEIDTNHTRSRSASGSLRWSATCWLVSTGHGPGHRV